MKRLCLLVIIFVFFSAPALAYDKALAKSYEQYFSPFMGMNTGKAMQLISAKDFMESQKKGDNLYVVDIRTPAETGVYGFNLTNSIAIPANEVFKPENLAKIPATMKVVLVCKGGPRAVAVATGLRHIGFNKVYALKQGFSGLADYLNSKNAY